MELVCMWCSPRKNDAHCSLNISFKSATKTGFYLYSNMIFSVLINGSRMHAKMQGLFYLSRYYNTCTFNKSAQVL